MLKSTFSPLYRVFRDRLVALRSRAGLRQRGLAERMRRERSFVARVELGERRVDLLEFYWLCLACEADPEAEAASIMRDFKSLDRPEPFERLGARHARPYRNCIPLYSLRAAAGKFAGGAEIEHEAEPEAWVRPRGRTRPGPGLFLARVSGESMNRRIPHGSYCVFRTPAVRGRIVLAQHREIHDPDHGGSYTVKKLRQESGRVILESESTRPGYPPTVFDGPRAAELRIVAELVEVLR
jgi:transcriptional regulator with XRE-family HTH domain